MKTAAWYRTTRAALRAGPDRSSPSTSLLPIRWTAEEAKHYHLLANHLRTLGHAYGDFDAHDGLWAMTLTTRDDFIARMALVPRTLEARGLDATPPIQAKLAQAGDQAAVAILDIILREEVGHVAIGNQDRCITAPIAAQA